jgi:hypothetical protein
MPMTIANGRAGVGTAPPERAANDWAGLLFFIPAHQSDGSRIEQRPLPVASEPARKDFGYVQTP